MVPIKKQLVNRKNYGNTRPLSDIKFIVIHYTANDGDTDENNAKYFTNNVVQVSAHYFVDSDSITNAVPENYAAWHCGGVKYAVGGKFYGKCTNANSIGIEICDDIKNGVVYPSAKTIQNVIDLTKSLMKKYNVPAEHIIRHYDVTGKPCPAYWVDDQKWKNEFWNKVKGVGGISVPPKTENPAQTNSVPYTVNIPAETDVYSAPAVTQIKKKGVYTIVEEKNGYGKLKSGVGWIKLSDVKKI